MCGVLGALDRGGPPAGRRRGWAARCAEGQLRLGLPLLRRHERTGRRVSEPVPGEAGMGRRRRALPERPGEDHLLEDPVRVALRAELEVASGQMLCSLGSRIPPCSASTIFKVIPRGLKIRGRHCFNELRAEDVALVTALRLLCVQ